MDTEWEFVADGCFRVKVPGGWIYRVVDYTGQQMTAIFVAQTDLDYLIDKQAQQTVKEALEQET